MPSTPTGQPTIDTGHPGPRRPITVKRPGQKPK